MEASVIAELQLVGGVLITDRIGGAEKRRDKLGAVSD